MGIPFLSHGPPFDKILSDNADISLKGKNVLVTGGTSGIGAAILILFAKHGANVYVAGRRADAGEKVLQEARQAAADVKEPDPDQVFEFHSFDASVISNCIAFSERLEKIFKEKGGLHFLVMTQGGMGNGERKETPDGHEWFLAVHDISRYIIAAKLMPMLKQSGEGTVLDLLSAGVWNRVDEHNLELNGVRPDFYHVASRDGPVHEVMTLEFNERCPEVRYHHLFPGAIKTSLTDNNKVDIITRLFFSIGMILFGVTPEHYAEVVFHIGTTWIRDPDHPEWRTWNEKGDITTMKPYPQRPEVRTTIWSYLENAAGFAI
ncbi:hypothetical protein FRC03_009400 [Tulasnella sp. 419]|nr:hypothetical protein FRC03_009400 [Tulasnella sp. 419]